MHPTLSPRTLVVGASSGIGAATARLLSERGHRLVLVARRRTHLESLAADLRTAGGEATALCLDITAPHAAEEIMDATTSILGGLDNAFNNAGALGAFKPISDQDPGEWDDLLSVNLKAIALLVRAELGIMAPRSSIVNTSSWLATGVLPGSSIYSATKAGLDAYTRVAALESASRGIRVNAVNPGGIDTAMTRQAFTDDAAMEAFASTHPLKRLGTSREVAEVVAFLLSSAASNITGQALLVDGGYALAGQRGVL